MCRHCSRSATLRVKYPPRYCATCGGEITSRSKARAVYCSVACKFADPEVRARMGPPQNRITKTCPGCGRDFEVPVSNASRYTYCTRRCSSNTRARDAVCARCGAPFRHSRTQTRRYCCEACRRPPVMITCAECGAAFRVVPSAQARKRFCTVRCYRASGAETSLERTVRLTLGRAGYDFRCQAQVGPWVVDFLAGHLVVEADGSYWHSLRPDVDRRKTADLAARGYTVWRLAETEIRHPEFTARLRARLAHYEVAGGELPRLTPEQAATLSHEYRVVLRQYKNPLRGRKPVKPHPDQGFLDFGDDDV